MPNFERPNEAEKSPQKEPTLDSLETKLITIEENIQRLKEKAEKARAEREQYVKQKLLDRETLIGKTGEINTLHRAAKQTLESLAPLRENEELKNNPELEKQWKGANDLVEELEQQMEEANKEVAKIEGQPEILDKVWDEAKGEDAKRNEKLERGKMIEELKKEAAAFAEEVRACAEKWNEWDKAGSERSNEIDVNEAKEKIAKLVEDTYRMFDLNSVPHDIILTLRRVKEAKSEEIDQVLAELKDKRESLGFFANRSQKRGIDHLLSQTEAFESYKVAVAEVNQELESQKRDRENELQNLNLTEKVLAEKYTELKKRYEPKTLAYEFYLEVSNRLESASKAKSEWKKESPINMLRGWDR